MHFLSITQSLLDLIKRFIGFCWLQKAQWLSIEERNRGGAVVEKLVII
ncbi:hypothetical protein [Candidatus Liberibacter solanacearum]|nr:hypothetical protein [Candidatus Liberibacter solanacearum]